MTLVSSLQSETRSHAHFNLSSLVDATAVSLITISFVLEFSFFFFACLLPSLSHPLHLPIIYCISLSSPRPPSHLFFFIFSFVLSPLVPAIGCRSPTTLMRTGGRWVINHLQRPVCVCVGLVVHADGMYSSVQHRVCLHLLCARVNSNF